MVSFILKTRPDMMKTLTLLAFVPLTAVGQSLVSQFPQDRTVLLEDFTGIHCGYCPEGHVIAASLEALHGPRLTVVGVHAGAFAVPGVGEPDFQTTDGTAIDAHFTIGGYPAGVISRHVFNGEDDLGRGAWEGAVAEMLALPSPVNLGMQSSFDAGTRDLTVNVELLYTQDSPLGDDHISVLLKENHINGPQTDYGPSGNHTNYDHVHVLRTYITSTWGDVVTTTTAGTTVNRTYTFNVPLGWDIANCEVVAFVSEYQSDVYQVREVAADGGTTLVVGDLAGASPSHVGGSNGLVNTFTNTFTNLLGADEDYQVTLTSYGSPATWASTVLVDNAPITNPGIIPVLNGVPVNIDVLVTPDATSGIGKYTLTVSSVNNPGAPVLEQSFHVISGVTDLIVTHPQAEPWEQLYIDGLTQANNQAFATTSKDQFIKFGVANALGGVNNLYVNVSWTFPSLTDDQVGVLAAFMDNGGDVMIAGQDIGWDQSGATGAYGTPVTQAFYASHLHATYVSDGSNASTTVNFLDADAVFGTVPNSGIADVFGGNTYPEQITPIPPAVGILHYNTNANQIGALRSDNGTYKVVYFGVGPEQMSNAGVGRSMIQLSHDWFYGVVSVEELDALLADALGQAYPVPASDRITIPLNALDRNAVLEITDVTGRVVLQQAVRANAAQVQVDLGGLTSGVYRYALLTPEGRGSARTFQVVR